MRVEFAHGIEMQSEPPPPLFKMIFGLRPVDNGEAGLSGEPKNFHLRNMDLKKRFRSVDNVNNARIFFNDRLKKAALGFKILLARMAGEKVSKNRQGSRARAAG